MVLLKVAVSVPVLEVGIVTLQDLCDLKLHVSLLGSAEVWRELPDWDYRWIIQDSSDEGYVDEGEREHHVGDMRYFSGLSSLLC